MKKKIGLLLAVVMVLNTVSSAAFAAWENPLKKYNLYEDVMGGSVDDGSRERVMDEFNSNSLRAGGDANYSSPYDNPNDFSGGEVEVPKTRNEDLRESSRNVYSDPEATPAWEEGPSFYPNPSFDSIVAKYKKSDFAGCLQECISYVRQYPNDTLGFYYLAMCYTKVADKDNAIMAYEKVISLNEHPMIVKYATNGRNCVMGNDDEKCYQNVNEPELVYPYLKYAQKMDLTPIDPEVLVNKNLELLRGKLSPAVDKEDEEKSKNGKDKKPQIVLPFGEQDEELDKFINAPYGNGLSPDLDKQYKQIQLKKLRDTINTGDDSDEKEQNDLKDIQKFDDQKTDAGTIKLAYASSDEFEKLSKDPEYIKQKQQYDELRMLLGNDSSSDHDEMMDMIPYMSEQQGDKKLSPEVIQAMMMKSMMNGLSL